MEIHDASPISHDASPISPISKKGDKLPTCEYLKDVKALLENILDWRYEDLNPQDEFDNPDIYWSHVAWIKRIESILDEIDRILDQGDCTE